MKINIEQRHIDEATRLVHREHKLSDRFCPTCLALRELFPEAKDIFVGFQSVEIDGKDYQLKDPARDWILTWVRMAPVVPIVFEMEAI